MHTKKKVKKNSLKENKDTKKIRGNKLQKRAKKKNKAKSN